MTIAINQPTYLPWIGYFDLIDQVDKFIFYDDVQIVKQSWGTRNQILTTNGKHWLSVPIDHSKKYYEKLYSNTFIKENNIWKLKHFKSIKYSYSKAPFFKDVITFIESLLFDNKNELLGEFNKEIIIRLAKKIGITTNFDSSTNLISKSKKKDQRLVKLCKELNATNYISPLGAKEYIEKNNESGAFFNTKINLYYQNFQHPKYKQLNNEFVSHLSIVDLLFHVGFEQAINIVKRGRKKLLTSIELKN